MENKDASNIHAAVTLSIKGIHCQSCVQRVEAALSRLAGVAEATVNLEERKANIRFDAAKVSVSDLKAAVEAAGYQILGNKVKDSELNTDGCAQPINWFSNPRSYLYGVLAAIAIIGFYMAMNTLTADWYFAKVQFSEYRWWIIALAIGLGVQVTLFTSFRTQLRGQKMRAAKSSMAASGGISATAMMACCSHYLATVIPVLGVPFLSAAAVASLAEYQTYFFLAGVISCLFGIWLMLGRMVKHGMIQTTFLKSFFSFRLGRVSG
jgi:copper ion binding protein